MDDHFKAQKCRLAIINFDDSPAEPMRVLDFDDQADIKDYIVLPYLTVKTQELIDEGVDRLYVTGVKQYCPISTPGQEASRITFADRLKFSKFMQETFAENNELRKLVKDLHTLVEDVLPERKSDYVTICLVEACIEHYSNTMPEIEDRMRGLGIKVS
jgi:hypothetical protein